MLGLVALVSCAGPLIKLEAQADFVLSKGVLTATISGVATSGLGPKNSKSKKLKATLGELESALSSWDQIIPNDENVASDDAVRAPRARSGGMPDEMKRRTRELLNQLKEQIEELSAEEKSIIS